MKQHGVRRQEAKQKIYNWMESDPEEREIWDVLVWNIGREYYFSPATCEKLKAEIIRLLDAVEAAKKKE